MSMGSRNETRGETVLREEDLIGPSGLLYAPDHDMKNRREAIEQGIELVKEQGNTDYNFAVASNVEEFEDLIALSRGFDDIPAAINSSEGTNKVSDESGGLWNKDDSTDAENAECADESEGELQTYQDIFDKGITVEFGGEGETIKFDDETTIRLFQEVQNSQQGIEFFKDLISGKISNLLEQDGVEIDSRTSVSDLKQIDRMYVGCIEYMRAAEQILNEEISNYTELEIEDSSLGNLFEAMEDSAVSDQPLGPRDTIEEFELRLGPEGEEFNYTVERNDGNTEYKLLESGEEKDDRQRDINKGEGLSELLDEDVFTLVNGKPLEMAINTLTKNIEGELNIPKVRVDVRKSVSEEGVYEAASRNKEEYGEPVSGIDNLEGEQLDGRDQTDLDVLEPDSELGGAAFRISIPNYDEENTYTQFLIQDNGGKGVGEEKGLDPEDKEGIYEWDGGNSSGFGHYLVSELVTGMYDGVVEYVEE